MGYFSTSLCATQVIAGEDRSVGMYVEISLDRRPAADPSLPLIHHKEIFRRASTDVARRSILVHNLAAQARTSEQLSN